MKTLAIGYGVAVLIAVAGCGRVVANAPGTAAPAPVLPRASSVSPALTEASSSQPVVTRLVAVVNYPNMGITLDPVDPGLSPPIPAGDAYSLCQRCPHGTPVEDFRQELAYFSANTPATIPAACVPQAKPPPISCKNPPTVPIYQHRLAWVFTWYEQCIAFGPPGRPPSTPFTCLNLQPFDATTADESYTFSGGA